MVLCSSGTLLTRLGRAGVCRIGCAIDNPAAHVYLLEGRRCRMGYSPDRPGRSALGVQSKRVCFQAGRPLWSVGPLGRSLSKTCRG